MQWPKLRESSLRPAFADIIDVIQEYEPVLLLTGSQSEKAEAKRFLKQQGVPDKNIAWHVIPVDNAWMRDNGPIYVTNGAGVWVQDWKFTAWGGNWGADVGFEKDNSVPAKVAECSGMKIEDRQDYVLERGNLEVNGAGTGALNWDCQDHRNPGLTKTDHETILRKSLGLRQIIWAYGHDPQDGTTGHIDGTARFIGRDTIVIADSGAETERNLAVSAEKTGLKVVWYPGDPNWLVGNGFVLAVSEGAGADVTLTARLKSFFPSRNIHMIDAETILAAGGGIHCVTNDQPEACPGSR
jgi:agmatine deiminase